MTKLLNPQEVIGLIDQEADIIIPIANGEPVRLLDILEENVDKLQGVKIHQMLALRSRPYIQGEYEQLKHVSYFLSGATRKVYQQAKMELVPNNFHEVPRMLQKVTKMSMIMTVASPMDEHGYFTFGTQADYVSEFVGKVPFILEVNDQMPRTYGRNQIHISQIAGFVEHNAPLTEEQTAAVSDKDLLIAASVIEDIKDGDTLQIGIGSVPNAVISMLKDHRHLGIHTEMLPDGIVDLVKAGAVDGTRKFTNPGKIVATFAYGSKKLYDFIDNNPVVEFLPVSIVNDPREIAKEKNIVSINATTEVDLFGQCASETVGGKYYSSSGGQIDFARGVRFAENGKGYICMQSTAKNETISRIKLQLAPGSVVTTGKNDVDSIVTEYGIARLHGVSISERAKRLIAIAHPNFREELLFDAKKNGIII
ncbi:acetyl-CoA hydrolase/transferase C-terminal domain-containing protein [Planococcus shenhongbingii]|uniref:Acetyl-CoA hydrolase/transferase C-terminal domain-containing protein n=1 Tax=Planococcus shenhongbingii TaxID=3058398 RepID=A0ABT8NFN5_9BACL|nr:MULTISPECIES: acetyl-CoA hydrolase/transferase C-terminal domain-containing protein [unclassified Planococcus (in: firmicutes)]MDN7246714.1 acetyl-CoA hydrolase/transferase C-terminal domain-containing protein [Planococcus sp. N017]WKA58926.1 acetyl-CoA hydrolase/transferase C-terminal domain-containing protein [Planococcus sp. N016]